MRSEHRNLNPLHDLFHWSVQSDRVILLLRMRKILLEWRPLVQYQGIGCYLCQASELLEEAVMFGHCHNRRATQGFAMGLH